MTIKTLQDFKGNYPGVYMLVLFILLIVTLYTILFLFYSKKDSAQFEGRGPPLRRRNAFKPGEIEKIMNNIRRLKNLRINDDENEIN